MHHSLRRPQSVPSFVRPLMASLALAFVAAVAQAAPVADVHALAQKEQQPLLDTLRDLVHIESGSKDIEGLNQIAERIAGQLKQLGGTVDVLQTSDIYRLDDTPEKVGPAVQAVFKGTGSKKIMLIAHMDTVYLKGMLKASRFASMATGPMALASRTTSRASRSSSTPWPCCKSSISRTTARSPC